MFTTPFKPNQKTCETIQCRGQVKGQQQLQQDHNSNQILPDLAMIFEDAQVPQFMPIKEPDRTSDNESTSCLLLSKNSHQENSPSNIYKWFDEFNEHPEKGVSKFGDTGSPYFIQQNSSNSSRESSDNVHLPTFVASGRESSTDEYRSVIDDLTIENKKLREQLRHYKRKANRQLEEDKLFEIRIHALSPGKRRELENALRSFALGLDYSSCELLSSVQRTSKQLVSEDSTQSPWKNLSTASTSKSRSENSSYSSMVTSTQPTTVNSGSSTNEGRRLNLLDPNDTRKNHEIFLDKHEDLPPTNGIKNMTHQQKKKLVVQRLEQIFTGEKGMMVGVHKHPLDKQGISTLQPCDESCATSRGVRQACIINQTDCDPSRPKSLSEESDEINLDGHCYNQRPTRPLELDPDCTQVPSDNVEYIRHLGLSTPQLVSDESTDPEKNEGGWVYLNLLINMAQLHIINVTTDFVRSAVMDISERFQLSDDGQMLRWKGGNKGTRLYTDSSSNSSQDITSLKTSAQTGCRPQEIGKKPSHRLAPNKLNESQNNQNGFHYQPFFCHRSPSENQSDSSEGLSGLGQTEEKTNRKNFRYCTQNGRQYNILKNQKGLEDGPLVFYRGANFCVDLSGDPMLDLLKLSNPNSEEDSDGEQDNCSEMQPPKIKRTSSGSELPYRPFKETLRFSSQHDHEELDTPENLPKDDLTFDPNFDIFPTNCQQGPVKSQAFEPSGVGGTRLSDHFEIHVTTRYQITNLNMSDKMIPHVSKNMRKLKSPIPFLTLSTLKSRDNEISTSLQSFDRIKWSVPSMSYHDATALIELPVQTKILSAETVNLKPSNPPCLSTLLYLSDSDVESETNLCLSEVTQT